MTILLKKKGVICTFLMVLGTMWGQAQEKEVLFDDFYFGMPKKEAKTVLKEHHSSSETFEMGQGVHFVVKKNSLVMDNDRLVELKLWTKNNLNAKQISAGLQKTRAYLEAQGYTMVYSQENWDQPLLIDTSKPCIRFLNEKQTVLLEMEPRGQGNKYNIYLNYSNMEWVKKHLTPSR